MKIPLCGLAILLLGGCADSDSRSLAKDHWEYWYATGADQTPGQGLHITTQQPDDTWELVSVVKTGDEYGFFFKRRK